MNEYEERANDAGKEAAEMLTKALNSMSYSKEVTKAFVESITHSHRTLQQVTMGTMMALIMAWAEMDENGCSDMRNEATVRFCSKIKELALFENAYFPFI